VSEKQPVVSLTDPVALRAYAHPLRMALVGLLRQEGPLTATQAAQKLGESVPNCSFHLRMLAKYGLVERVEGADAREKPWRATADATYWRSDSTDPKMQTAVDQLDAMAVARYLERAREFLARRDAEPPQWRQWTGPGDATIYLTADELRTLIYAMDGLLDEFRRRQSDPSLRPPDARAVSILQFVLTQQAPDTPEESR
jgi:predicted ArsR family transcriptional regulator